MDLKHIIKQVGRIAVPVVGGQLIGKFAVQNARSDYKDYNKPPLSPPGYVFPIVWSALYLSMGIAHNIVAQQKNSKDAEIPYYTQLGLNYLWSILYFKYKLRGAALIESFVLLVAVITTTVQFYNQRRVAGFLFIPYVCWSAFASYLATGNWLLNKDNPSYSNEPTQHD